MNFERFYDKLIIHYRLHGRDLPWRKSQNPYSVWVSEVILQQTRVLQGQEYFMTFLRYFPNIHSLANASEQDLLKIWQGLGYYSRALNMHKAAKTIVEKYHGNFPDTYESIRSLPGIGDYTAAAIASISFGLHLPAIDGNVKRVISRLFGLSSPIQKKDFMNSAVKILNESIIHYNPGEFNQALMELGATICVPGKPLCSVCPLSDQCFAFIHNKQSALPVSVPKKKPAVLYIHYLFLEFQNQTWIIRRGKDGIWKSLYEFPSFSSEAKSEQFPAELAELISEETKSELISKKNHLHKLTHRTIFATFWHFSGLPSNIVKETNKLIEIPLSEIHQYPVHRLMHRFLEQQGIL